MNSPTASRRLARPLYGAATDSSSERSSGASTDIAPAVGTGVSADTGCSADARWAAVLGRDRQFDGEFVYAVRTTGVFCRPSCPSRQARRENVEFFDTTHLAQAAGYRPCKRCAPDQVSLEHRRNDTVTAACRAIEDSATLPRLEDLARAAGLSPHHFHRVFRQVTGVTPSAYAGAIRQKRMQASLAAAPSVTEAIHEAGFNSSSRFYETGAAALGMAPAAWRAGGAGEQIRHAVEPCALGMIIVAATRRGVCAIEFGDSAEVLVKRLRARFPKAVFEPADPEFLRWIGSVLAFIEQPESLLDLPLDIRGTVFQRRVWQALREIPTGRRVSYSQVAQAIGRPDAVRAVASACASNAVALAIPCHRVVRTGGGMAGYRWGVERKAELLRRETVLSDVQRARAPELEPDMAQRDPLRQVPPG